MEWLIVQEWLNYRANANISSWCKIGPWQKPFLISSQDVIWVQGVRMHVLIWSGTWGKPCQVKKRGQCRYDGESTETYKQAAMLKSHYMVDATKMQFETLGMSGQINRLCIWAYIYIYMLLLLLLIFFIFYFYYAQWTRERKSVQYFMVVFNTTCCTKLVQVTDDLCRIRNTVETWVKLHATTAYNFCANTTCSHLMVKHEK